MVGPRLGPCTPWSDWRGGWTGGTWWWEEPDHPLLVPAEPIQPASLGTLPPLSQGVLPRGMVSEVSPGRGLVQTLAFPPSSYVRVTS